MLADIEMKINRLRSIENIKQAIEQVESGEVQAIRDLIGPKAGRSSNKQWRSIKSVVTRRERMYSVYEEDFGNDMASFLQYFSKPAPASGQKRKAQATEVEGRILCSFTQVTETLMPGMEVAIKAEKEKEAYKDNGIFYEALWREKWSDKHRFEVWDILKSNTDTN